MINKTGEPRPEGFDRNQWKNRFRVSAKLTEEHNTIFLRWLRKKNFNYNSGINYLIHTHPELKDNA